jgi:transcriptional regulator with XRE-family HTH domain
MINFAKWLEKVLEMEGWTRADLARQAHVSPSSLSMIVNGQRNPGEELCSSIARALNIPPEIVFEEAGLLQYSPPAPKQANLILWIENELQKRDLTVEQAAEKANISTYLFHRILYEKRRPSMETIEAISSAFNISPVLLADIAGMLNITTNEKLQAESADFLKTYTQLDDANRQEIFEFTKLKLKLQVQSEKKSRNKSPSNNQ